MEFTTCLSLILAAAGAGVVNALAGGGTLLTFPALTAIVPAVVANGTSTVALMPGSFASILGYRRELQKVRRWAAILCLPSIAGGLIGVELVIRFPNYFDRLVPWLILIATMMFIAQPLVARIARTGHKPWPTWLALLVQFLISIYGGYFGAGMGIVMLAVYAFMGMPDIHTMNAVKSVQAVVINVVAAIGFIRVNLVVWQYSLIMAVAAIIGGYYGAHYGRRLNRSVVRGIVIGIGLTLSAFYFGKRYFT
jgi:uncharacterized membrane protein YfcA